ncbi:hypothetical protein NDU88_002381 [Pleurodeles waltl]|uniref:Uncharacterized protein n=1 Tax=Pleurodeles waltl TaxID=8319 RepID=A0AAV7M1E1_PLEWA|nr:hypothetical protein NDU88_002381 [Pleurodeles waltl]
MRSSVPAAPVNRDEPFDRMLTMTTNRRRLNALSQSKEFVEELYRSAADGIGGLLPLLELPSEKKEVLTDISPLHNQLFLKLRHFFRGNPMVRRRCPAARYNSECSSARVALTEATKQQDVLLIQVTRRVYKNALQEAKREWKSGNGRACWLQQKVVNIAPFGTLSLDQSWMFLSC